MAYPGCHLPPSSCGATRLNPGTESKGFNCYKSTRKKGQANRSLGNMKRTHTPLANGVAGNVEPSPEVYGFLAIDDLQERSLVNVPQREVEKARSHGAVGFNDC